MFEVLPNPASELSDTSKKLRRSPVPTREPIIGNLFRPGIDLIGQSCRSAQTNTVQNCPENGYVTRVAAPRQCALT